MRPFFGLALRIYADLQSTQRPMHCNLKKKKKKLLFFIFIFPQTTVIRNHLKKKKKFAHNECISHEETVDEEKIANC